MGEKSKADGHLRVEFGRVEVTEIRDGRGREIRVRVDFRRPFAQPPAMTASLSSLDLAGPHTRIAIRLTEIEADHFEYLFWIGPETIVEWAQASWMAIGADTPGE